MKTTLISFMLLVSLISVSQTKWADSIKNPKNAEYLTEVAFNLGIKESQVTQAQFNARYLPDLKGDSLVIHAWDSTTNIVYLEANKKQPVYATKNHKIYIARISKAGRYYRKYITINQ